MPELAALLCCLSFLLSTSAAFPARDGRLHHHVDFYSVIYSEQGFCLLCACNAPCMHYYRNNLTQSAWHFRHQADHRQKSIWPKKPAFLCSLCWIWKSRKYSLARALPVPLLALPQFPPGSSLIGPWWVFAGRTRCFPVSARAAASRDMNQV